MSTSPHLKPQRLWRTAGGLYFDSQIKADAEDRMPDTFVAAGVVPVLVIPLTPEVVAFLTARAATKTYWSSGLERVSAKVGAEAAKAVLAAIGIKAPAPRKGRKTP